MFSSRRQSIGPLTARLAQAYEAQYGRAPDARALTSLRQWANHATRRGKDAGPLDLGGASAPLVGAGLRERGWRAGTISPSGDGRQCPRTAQRASRQAPAPAQRAERAADRGASATPHPGSGRRRAGHPANLDRSRPDPAPRRAPARRDRRDDRSRTPPSCSPPWPARRWPAPEAVMLSAPEWPRVPDCLRRASGESLYVPHGAARYATGAQLTLEDRLLADAQEPGAPRLEPATAARLLGAEQARLEAQLQAHSRQPGRDQPAHRFGPAPGPGRRRVPRAHLQPPRRGDGRARPGPARPAPSREMARIWREAGMGEVIGLATSQTACNVLAEAGVHPRATTPPGSSATSRASAKPCGPLPVAAGVAADPGRGQHDVAGRHGRDPRPGPRQRLQGRGDRRPRAARRRRRRRRR